MLDDNTTDDNMVYVVMGAHLETEGPSFIVEIFRQHDDATAAVQEYHTRFKNYHYWINNHWLN